ncbi:MAG: hypothetical protein ACON4Z_10890 [Planctomycetota bacterium]
MSADAPRPPLLLATLCWLLPMLLGSIAFFGWLVWTGGKSNEGEAFQLLGAAVLSAAPAFLLIGAVALVFARKRGAARPLLRRRALLLFANVPLALAYVLGTSVAAIQRVEVINRSGRAAEQVSLTACRTATCDVGALADGERYVWRFSPPSEGTLSVTGRLGDEIVAREGACMFFVFDRIDVTLELQPSGEWTVHEAPGAPWSWLPGF